MRVLARKISVAGDVTIERTLEIELDGGRADEAAIAIAKAILDLLNNQPRKEEVA